VCVLMRDPPSLWFASKPQASMLEPHAREGCVEGPRSLNLPTRLGWGKGLPALATVETPRYVCVWWFVFWQLRLEAARSLALGENHCGGQITIMIANMLPIQTHLHSDAIMVLCCAAPFLL